MQKIANDEAMVPVDITQKPIQLDRETLNELKNQVIERFRDLGQKYFFTIIGKKREMWESFHPKLISSTIQICECRIELLAIQNAFFRVIYPALAKREECLEGIPHDQVLKSTVVQKECGLIRMIEHDVLYSPRLETCSQKTEIYDEENSAVEMKEEPQGIGIVPIGEKSDIVIPCLVMLSKKEVDRIEALTENRAYMIGTPDS